MRDIQTTDIEQKALELFPVKEKLNKKGTGSYDANLPRRRAWIEGVQWRDAQMPDLPDDLEDAADAYDEKNTDDWAYRGAIADGFITGAKYEAAQFEALECEGVDEWCDDVWQANTIRLPKPIKRPYKIYVKK